MHPQPGQFKTLLDEAWYLKDVLPPGGEKNRSYTWRLLNPISLANAGQQYCSHNSWPLCGICGNTVTKPCITWKQISKILEDDINQEIWLACGQGWESFPLAAWPLLQWPLQKLLQFPVYYKKQWMGMLWVVQTRFKLNQEDLSRQGQQQRHRHLTRITMDCRIFRWSFST